MTLQSKKIIIDIIMTMFLALSFVRWQTEDAMFHFAVGTACVVAFAAHAYVHRKWLKVMTKQFFAGKIKKAFAAKYVVDAGLVIFWGVSVATGFLALGYFVGGVAGMAFFGRIHGITARIGLVLVTIHIIQHIPQIKSYLNIKRGRAHGA